jgi:uncharacterized protein (DUF1501 family)
MRTSVLLACLLCTLLTSCIVVAAGAVAAAAYGAVSYNENEASMTVKDDLATATAAAKKAMRDLNFPVDETQQPSVTECTLKGGEATVVLERHPGEVTKICVRIGTFDTKDNQRRAGLLVEKIRANL